MSRSTREVADTFAAVTGGTNGKNPKESLYMGTDGAVSASVTPVVDDTENMRCVSCNSMEEMAKLKRNQVELHLTPMVSPPT